MIIILWRRREKKRSNCRPLDGQSAATRTPAAKENAVQSIRCYRPPAARLVLTAVSLLDASVVPRAVSVIETAIRDINCVIEETGETCSQEKEEERVHWLHRCIVCLSRANPSSILPSIKDSTQQQHSNRATVPGIRSSSHIHFDRSTTRVTITTALLDCRYERTRELLPPPAIAAAATLPPI